MALSEACSRLLYLKVDACLARLQALKAGNGIGLDTSSTDNGRIGKGNDLVHFAHMSPVKVP